MPEGNFVRADLPPGLVAFDVDFIALTDVGADAWAVTRSGWSLPTVYLAGSVDCNNNTKTNAAQWLHRCSSYKTTVGSSATGQETAQTQVTVKIMARLTGAPATSATLELSVCRSDRNGGKDTTIGTAGELCFTGAQNMKSVPPNTWINYTFECDGEELLPNDVLNMAFRAVLNDSGGAGGGHLEIGAIEVDYYQH